MCWNTLQQACNEYLRKFRRKNNVSFKSEYRQNNLSNTPVSFFVFVSLLIATYILLKLIIEFIESNPCPSYGGGYAVKKAVQGTFHQGNTRFGESVGTKMYQQCIIILSAIKKVSLWKAIEINYILDKGDILFQPLGINQPLAVDELPHACRHH